MVRTTRVAGATLQDTGAAWVLNLNGTVSREEKISLSESSFGLPIKDGDIDEDSGAVFNSHLNNRSVVIDIYTFKDSRNL